MRVLLRRILPPYYLLAVDLFCTFVEYMSPELHTCECTKQYCVFIEHTRRFDRGSMQICDKLVKPDIYSSTKLGGICQVSKLQRMVYSLSNWFVLRCVFNLSEVLW